MKILKVIHGYPPIYNAGSEVYSQLLCNALEKKGQTVEVFTREENMFEPDYSVRLTTDHLNANIKCHLVNIPLDRHRYRYTHPEVDDAFEKVLDDMNPDVVHIGHLNHLSLTLVDRAKKRNIPIVYTIHDFWLMCMRGRFIQRNSCGKDLLASCSGQQDLKCAKQCYAGYFSGIESQASKDELYWEAWVADRMQAVREMCAKVDLFIAPSRELRDRYLRGFCIPKQKVQYLDYCFDLERLAGRKRCVEQEFVFGYIGTHTPEKGIDLLLKAFAKLNNKTAKLRIWGRPLGQNTPALMRMMQCFPEQVKARIEWMPEYQNDRIVTNVFNHVDAIVVPSLWQENSPLVIHEALQARVGVITSDFGGMGEYVKHGQNGWNFKHRDFKSLATIMDSVVKLTENEFIQISHRGYLQSDTGEVVSAEQQADDFIRIYRQLIKGKAYGPEQVVADYV